MQCDGATDLTGDLVVKLVMKIFFDAFRKILREQKLDSYFRESCFGKYPDLPEDNNARFQMKMVYDLLKRRFMYKNKDKIDEAWAFEVIPYLRQQVNYQEEVSCPRILRWLSAKTDKNAKFLDLFNSPKEAIFSDFAASSECFSCKCQDYKEKHDGVISVINALTASVKEMTSKRGVIPSKRISYPDTPLEIKAAKRRRKDTSKASSIIKKSKIAMPLSLSFTDVQCVRATEEQHELKKSMIEAYRDKMANPFDVQYVDGIAQQTIGSLDCGPFVAAYTEYLSDGLQVTNDGLDAGLLRKRYASLLWKYGEAKVQKSYATDVKDPRRPKPNSIALDEEQLVHID
ncbi:hypothetical protein T459_17756 [Capsicum annuum]|uniref:Ubiquitin-like protease family profile domain-containing protein n=1 Tax=Capsicum annuum TaxID=4072 RepID=A0A2G2ZCN3_CAPAN|nr:hypothetical protein T459_17756 [Capsicum annuum]